jgi:hypothetical protein
MDVLSRDKHANRGASTKTVLPDLELVINGIVITAAEEDDTQPVDTGTLSIIWNS